MNENILIVEDEETLRHAIRRHLSRRGYRVFEAGTCAEAKDVLASERVDVVLVDVLLPDGRGYDLIEPGSKSVDVIVMTGDDSIDNAIAALKHGAADFLLKPFSMEALVDSIERIEHRRDPLGKNRRTSSPAGVVDEWRARHAPGMLGSSNALARVFHMLERVADTDCSVLITGESGTGKELVARALHRGSDRRDRPFVTVNCAAIPENLLESELFGHARGAFTGATNARVGRFTAADGGTIFLDEIGELPLALQAKLLRVLQEKEISPVGEARTHHVDVRVVAATNRDLEEMVEEGKFREDLLYRLNVIPVELPSLRERREDIPELVAFFIERCNERRGRKVAGISEEAMAALLAYEWPGNIRQLENTIERMVVLKTEGALDVIDLPRKIRAGASVANGAEGAPLLPDDGIDLRDAVEQFENALILQALERTGWNKNQAASILRMNRTTLVEKIKKKGFDERAAS